MPDVCCFLVHYIYTSREQAVPTHYTVLRAGELSVVWAFHEVVLLSLSTLPLLPFHSFRKITEGAFVQLLSVILQRGSAEGECRGGIAGVGWSSRMSRVCVVTLVVQCQF